MTPLKRQHSFDQGLEAEGMTMRTRVQDGINAAELLRLHRLLARLAANAGAERPPEATKETR